MTKPVTLFHGTWTTTEPDPDDRHRLPVKIRWTETIIIRPMTSEELAALAGDKLGRE